VQLSPLPALTDPPQLSQGGETPSDPTGATSPQIVNINTAGIDELTTLKNIGPVLAQRIISFRDKNGPFKNVTDLLKVEGIGTKTLESILDNITVGG
jgi:competence protein ComEA